MFSVYGVAGQLFNGPLEDLKQVQAVHALVRTRAVGASGQERSPADAAAMPHHAGGNASHHNPLAAYTQTDPAHLPRHPLTRVAELMSRSVITVSFDSTVLDAWQLLASHGVSQAPVVDAAQTLVGLLSRADLLRPDRLPLPGSNALVWRALMMQSVADIMWTPVPGVAAQTDIRRVARVLLDTGLPGLPVVDEQGAVIGFVSRSDILRAVVADPPLDLWG